MATEIICRNLKCVHNILEIDCCELDCVTIGASGICIEVQSQEDQAEEIRPVKLEESKEL